MSIKLGLKFMAMTGLNGMDADLGHIIHSRILETTDRLALRFLEYQKLYVPLDRMPGGWLFIPLGLYCSCLGIPETPIQAISLENPIPPPG